MCCSGLARDLVRDDLELDGAGDGDGLPSCGDMLAISRDNNSYIKQCIISILHCALLICIYIYIYIYLYVHIYIYTHILSHLAL